LKKKNLFYLISALKNLQENVEDIDGSKLEGEEKKKWTYSTLADLYGGYESDEFEEETDMPEKAKPRLMRFMESIAESKAFQYVSEIGFIRRSLEDVSDTDLTMTVEIELIKGRLAINIPHPPSDRMWYGFMPKPTLSFKVIPKMGGKDINFTMVTDWLEKKLVSEFHTVNAYIFINLLPSRSIKQQLLPCIATRLIS
jgi:hypothetical protein